MKYIFGSNCVLKPNLFWRRKKERKGTSICCETGDNLSININELDHPFRCATYLNLGKYSEALEDANKSIELDDSNVKAYHRRGTANMKLENFDAAIRDYEKVCLLSFSASGPRPFPPCNHLSILETSMCSWTESRSSWIWVYRDFKALLKSFQVKMIQLISSYVSHLPLACLVHCSHI